MWAWFTSDNPPPPYVRPRRAQRYGGTEQDIRSHRLLSNQTRALMCGLGFELLKTTTHRAPYGRYIAAPGFQSPTLNHLGRTNQKTMRPNALLRVSVSPCPPWLSAALVCVVSLALLPACAPGPWPHDDRPAFDLPALNAEINRALSGELPPDTTVYQPPTDPDGTLALSLEDAAVMTLFNHPDLAAQRLGPVIAGAFAQIEAGDFDAEIFGQARTGQEVRLVTDRATQQEFGVTGRDADAELGVRQSLPSGTDLELSVTQRRRASDRAPEQQEANVNLTLTQALLRGADRRANLVRLRQARLDVVASVHQLRGFAAAVLARTETAYWRFVLADRSVAIFERGAQVARRQRDDTQKQIDAGALAPSQAAASAAEAALREQGLIDARAAREATRFNLLSLIAPSDRTSAPPPVRVTTLAPTQAQPVTDLPDRITLAQRQRADLNEARLQLEQDRLETRLTHDGVLPRLDFFVNLSKTGFADTFNDSFRDLDGATYDVSGGLRLSRSLSNRAPVARDLAARARRQRSAHALENLARRVRLEVRLAANEVERLRQQMAAAVTTRNARVQVARAEAARQAAGTGTALQVALAQRDQLAAEIAEAEVQTRYRIALINLHLAEGTLLERRGVSITPPGERTE